MALTDENGGNGFYMPVAPAYGGGNNGGGFGGWGGDWGWIILLLLLAGGNGWGNGFGGGGFGGGFGGMYEFPWLMTGQQGINTNTNNGFQNALLNDNVTSIRDGISNLSTQLCGCCGDISTQLCNGFAGTTAAITGAQNALAQQMYTNQIADLERSFAAQTASTAGMSAIQSQLANCCCENRAATQDLKYTIATEECATRANATANTQTILDKLCQLELDGYKRENDNLRSQLSDARFAASQTAQNAFIAQGLSNEVDSLYNRLSNCPVPSVPVYGRQPIFNCNTNNNCNCGCGCGM
jgi:hypothetical protein